MTETFTFFKIPEWVVDALDSHLPVTVRAIWDPFNINDDIVKELRYLGYTVEGTNAGMGVDFLTTVCPRIMSFDAIVTYPAHSDPQRYIGHALKLTQLRQGVVAMLLTSSYDNKRSKNAVFADCKLFSKKLVLTSPVIMANSRKYYAWYIWNWKHVGKPTLVYGENGREQNHGRKNLKVSS